MSMTSGPTVPESTGKLTAGEPSEKVSVAVRSVIVVLRWVGDVRLGLGSRCVDGRSVPAQQGDEGCDPGGRLGAAGDQVPQLLIRQVEQDVEHRHLVLVDGGAARVEEAREDEVVLEHAPAAAPAQAREADGVDHRVTMLAVDGGSGATRPA